VIDELMGHEGSRTAGHGSRMGNVYRHTTADMLNRVVTAVDDRLQDALKTLDD
jgi:hypothetical protein